VARHAVRHTKYIVPISHTYDRPGPVQASPGSPTRAFLGDLLKVVGGRYRSVAKATWTTHPDNPATCRLRPFPGRVQASPRGSLGQSWAVLDRS
jgi:hypothetical protein